MKPMLAVRAQNIGTLRYPLMCSFKMDGIRALVTPQGPKTRSLKPVPNRHIAAALATLPHGLDGELVILDADGYIDFRSTTSGVMSEAGTPSFKFCIFDNYLTQGPYWRRYQSLPSRLPHWVQIVEQWDVVGPGEVVKHFETALDQGFEGLILRDKHAAYKHNRSTLAEQGMIKVKPWVDTEAAVVGFVEEYENTNEATRNELGRTKRSSAQAGKVPKGTLGTLVVKSPEWAREFEIGTGFTAEDRSTLWRVRESLIGKIVKFKYVNAGGYDVPRHCVFLGFRDPRDMS